MKKILSIILTVVMLLSVSALSASAEGSIYLTSDFTSEELTNKQFFLGKFFTDTSSGILSGYSDALALQSAYDDENPTECPYGWITYDSYCEVSFSEDDLADGNRYFSIVYCNNNHGLLGLSDGAYYMSFCYDIANQKFYLCGDTTGFDEEKILMGPVDYAMETDGSEFYSLGISVSDGRMRCFVGDTLIFDLIDTANEYYIGNTVAGAQPTTLLWWNDNNFLQFRSIKIASAGFLYPFELGQENVTTSIDESDGTVGTNATENTENGPAPSDTTGNEPAPSNTTAAAPLFSEATTSEVVITVTDEAGGVVTDEAGAAVTSVSIVTDAPSVTATAQQIGTVTDEAGAAVTTSQKAVTVTNEAGEVVTDEAGAAVTSMSIVTNPNVPAATNTGRPTGGNSTATGDATFVVIATMVAALGCAIIVRKVSL